MKTIAIVLSKFTDPVSRLVSLLNGCNFTHVSLSLDAGMDAMYSFTFKGFTRESAAKFKRHGVEQVKCYQLRISDGAYQQLQQRIARFETHREDYRYSLLGVICCFLHIPYHAEKKYFCSQFVAESLQAARAVYLRKRPARYLPGNLMRELNASLQLARVQYHPL